MFIETPSPPPRRAHRLPSAYVFDGPSASASHSQSTSSDDPASSSNAAEQVEKAGRERPRGERRGSTYSTQSLPLSFNDLPCRAQHLILNQLMRSQSGKTAVLFTTLPAPVEGTAGSEERCWAYLNDLEVLTGNNGKGGRGEGGGGGSGEGGGEGTTPGGVGLPDMPPTMLVHSNSMTVTMSL